jgi:hypothetical protein
MYLIAPATIIFGGAEMHIDPALLSRRRSLERSWEAAPRWPPPSTPKRYKIIAGQFRTFAPFAQRYSIVRFWPST